MSAHRQRGNPRPRRIPDWLAAWYAFLVFMTVVTIASLYLK